jgi:protease IV
MNDDSGGGSARSVSGGSWERATLEKLVFATLKEQRSVRRWRMFSRLLWLVLVGAIAWYFYQQQALGVVQSAPHTAVIEIRGEISSDAAASADNIVGSLKSAFEDKGAQAVVLLIDSPGGSPVQAGIINDEITRLKALHQKKVYAVVEETCASAAYYIAAAADEIYVDKASLVGSIGVLMDGFGFTGLMEKLGIERRLMTAGENKAMLDPFSPQNPEQSAYIQTMLGEIHGQFIEVVKRGRGARLKETPDMFSGLVWSGPRAVDIGLADGLGSLDSVAREIVKAEDIVDYTQRENLGSRLARQFGASIGQGFFLAAKASGLQLR